MAEKKEKKPRSRVHTLPVRVVAGRAPAPKAPAHQRLREVKPPRPETIEPVSRASVDVMTAPSPTRVRVAWISIAAITLLIIVGWIVTVGSSLSKPGQPNSLWVKIRTSLKQAFTREEPAPTPQQKEVEDLNERVFPDAP